MRSSVPSIALISGNLPYLVEIKVSSFKRIKDTVTVTSTLALRTRRYYGHLAIRDTPLLRSLVITDTKPQSRGCPQQRKFSENWSLSRSRTNKFQRILNFHLPKGTSASREVLFQRPQHGFTHRLKSGVYSHFLPETSYKGVGFIRCGVSAFELIHEEKIKTVYSQGKRKWRGLPCLVHLY